MFICKRGWDGRPCLSGRWRVAGGDRSPLAVGQRPRANSVGRSCQCPVACLIPPRGVPLTSHGGPNFLAAEIYPLLRRECDSADSRSPVYDEAKRCCCFQSCSLSEFQSRTWFMMDSQSQYLQFVFFTLQFSRVPGVLLLCFRELSLAWEHIEKNMQWPRSLR